MLKVFGTAIAIAIVIWGIIELIKLFSSWRLKKKEEKYQATQTLNDLEEKARAVAAEKETILGEANRNKEVIDNINETLNQ
jgi:prepilin signal peptidase PulO-like enzyme (type II secretory pathway)